MEGGGDVRVVCRFRPQNEKEKNETGMGKTCMLFKDEKTVQILGDANVTAADRTFRLDRVFPCETRQTEVYEFAARPVIDSVLQGYNGTILAYGQTSSGKTFTMNGVMGDSEYKGIIPRMVETIFEGVDQADEHIEFTVKVSIAEIYNERIRDLLNPERDNLKVHEDKARGIYVGDITEEYVTCEDEVYALMDVGQGNRAVAATNMNAHSSRSHLIFMLTVNQKNMHDLSNKTGKLYLVDLAGSEKVGKTGATGSVLDEAKGINKSLSCLGNVINSLTDSKASHIPYRDSKLTRVLQESLGGNAKTTLIVTASPSVYNEQETVSTLRFGMRAKAVKNKAVVNQERSVEELKMLLSKAEAVIAKQQQRIALLEQTIVELGGTVPEGGIAIAAAAPGAPSGSVVVQAAAAAGVTSGGIADPEVQTDLLDELEDKRAELGRQAEHISELNKRILQLTERNQALETENNLLVSRVADATVEAETVKYELLELQDSYTAAKTTIKGLEQELQVVREAQKSATAALVTKETESDELQAKLQKAIADLQRIQALRALDAETQQQVSGTTTTTASSSMDTASHVETSKTSAAVSSVLTALDAAVAAAAANGGQVDNSSVESVRELCVSLSKKNEALNKQCDALKKVAYGPNAGNSDAAWSEERTNLLDTLETNQGRVVDLEVSLQEERERSSKLKVLLKEGEKPLRKKVATLDSHLEHITILYHKLVSQNSGLKVECQVNEKKLKRKDERIDNLERALKEAKGKYEKLLAQCASLTQTVENMHLKSSSTLMSVSGINMAANPGQAVRRNISRPVRGGGGTLAQYFKKPAQVGNMASEVAALQSEALAAAEALNVAPEELAAE